MNNPQYLNSLKAGIKTAIITFITAMVGVLTTLMSAAQSWINTGNPPDLSVAKGTVVAAVLALVIGISNTVMRFIQAGAVPILGTLLDKLIGVIPDYLPPPESPVDDIGGPVPLNRDGGESTIIVVLAVLAIIALVIWIVGHR